MAVLRIHLPTAVVVRMSDSGMPSDLFGLYGERAKDSEAALNLVCARWDRFLSESEGRAPSTELDDIARLEYITSAFSFTIFFFLLRGFLHGIHGRVRTAVADVGVAPSVISAFPAEQGVIRDLRTLRNKMVAHTAHLEPRKESVAERVAYLLWDVGPELVSGDYSSLRLNATGVGVEGEVSEHASLPTFGELVDEVQGDLDGCCAEVDSAVSELRKVIAKTAQNRYIITD